MPPTTSSLEAEWDYSGRKGRDGQKKKIGKANERKEKVKRGKDEKVNEQGWKRGAPAPHGADIILTNFISHTRMDTDNRKTISSAVNHQ